MGERKHEEQKEQAQKPACCHAGRRLTEPGTRLGWGLSPWLSTEHFAGDPQKLLLGVKR